MTHPSYPRGMQISTTQAIIGYPRHPPLGIGLNLQGYKNPKKHFNQKLPFNTTLDILDLSPLTNDPIYYCPFWETIPTKLPSDIPKF